MSAFHDDDERLGTMHGYGPGMIGVVTLYPPTRDPYWPESLQMAVMASKEFGEQMARLEAKLDALTKALKAGAIGRWQ